MRWPRPTTPGSGRTRRAALLDAYGLPLVPERVAATADDAAAAAAELGFPVVVKSAEPGAHKTETGGVALELEDEDAVRAAAGGSAVPSSCSRSSREASSCSPASCRTPSSARSSPSARAESSPS